MTATRIGYQTVKISDIILPGDMPKVRREKFTQELAASFEWTGGGPMQPIVIDSKYRLRAGRHRVAALMNLGAKKADVVVFDGDDASLARLTDIENACRSHDPDKRNAAIARLVAEVAANEEPPPEPEKPRPGRPSTPTGRAVREVAKRTGLPPSTVATAVYRHEAKTAPKPEAEPPCIATMGIEVPDDVLADAKLEHDFLSMLTGKLTVLDCAFSKHRNETGRPPEYYGHANEDIHNVGARLRSLMPESVCPWCKCTSLLDKCIACGGRGWLTKQERRQVTDEALLREGDEARVYVDGRMVLVSALKE